MGLGFFVATFLLLYNEVMPTHKTSQKQYSPASHLWISLVITVVTAILNFIFIGAVLAQKSSFLLYTFSPKQGVDTTLLDITAAASITSLWVLGSIIVTLLVAVLVLLKKRDLIRLIIMLQILLIGIGVSFIVNSVIRIQAGTELVSFIGSGVVIIAATTAAVGYVRLFNPMQPSRVTSKSKRKK